MKTIMEAWISQAAVNFKTENLAGCTAACVNGSLHAGIYAWMGGFTGRDYSLL
jgi:hypothetical protein